ncbi:hypothetical protein [Streptomyces globisporus]
MPPPDAPPRNRPTFTAIALKAFGWWLLIIGVLVIVFLLDRDAFEKQVSLGVVGGLPTGVILLLLIVWLMVWLEAQPPDETAVGESRERLTRAEGALTDAIRREYTMASDITIGGSLTHSSDRTAWQIPEEEDQEPDPPTTGEPGRRGVLGLPELWEATHARLDLYHQIATGQAKTSFRNAQIAMVAGFLLLVVFAGIAVWASTTAVAIVAGGLGAVSAALAGYVAKTFIRSQEAAATHLRSYFDQPLELSRYLAAERLVADGDLTQEQRGEILSALVQAMVAGPQPPAPTQAVAVVPVPGQQGA